MNENKITTYVFYAMGEIVLVVAGIIIAIQLDDYSKRQNDQETVKKYINSLVKELEGNVGRLEHEISFTKEKMDTLQTLKELMAKPGANIDTLKHVARYQFDYGYDSEVSLNDITFQTLESTGDITLLDQRLRDTLYVYHDYFMLFKNIIQRNMDFYTQIDIDYHKTYPSSGPEQFLEKGLLDELWNNIDRNDFALRFNALVSNKIIAHRYILVYQEYLLRTTQFYLEFIKENYT